jgi:hypothetical protein
MVTSCGEEPSGPTFIEPPDDGLVVTQLELNGQTYEIQTDLARNFWLGIPPIGPDGEPLIAGIRLVEVDSLAIPRDVTMDYLWVVNGDETWATEFTDEERPPQPPYRIERVARNGPKWGPGITVDVVARVRAGDGAAYRVLARDQMITRTW